MNTTTATTIEQPYTTTNESPHTPNNYLFVIAFFVTVFLIFTITYACYFFKRLIRSQPSLSLHVTTDRFSRGGLDDDVLLTFPMFIYSDAKIAQKGDDATLTDDTNNVEGSGCSICLVDYKQRDIVRVLPECRHLFHVKCIDTWLKVHPTCPVCRNSPLAGFVAVSIPAS